MSRLLTSLMLAATLASSACAESTAINVVADGLGFPEGTILVNQTLYFVDYQASTVNKLDAAGHKVVAALPGCGANGLAAANGTLWVACYDGGVIENISLDGKRLGTIRQARSGERFNRPNDLIPNRRGDLYFTASGERPGEGKVFFLPKASDVAEEVASGLDNANGIALAPDDHTLYVGESGTDSILQYQTAGDGTLTHPRVFARLDALAPPSSKGRHTPDGVRIGPDGLMYVALYNGGGYWVLDRTGALLRVRDIPGEHHSNLAVATELPDIYVTALSGSTGRIYRLARGGSRY
ncbi:MAG: SMP-30/gluconolactonase/LRE family protein [Achromobacter ruhlandii]|jgi:gluconolactonase|nr:SMP-30/gluconolactonase/LRE family protein [Achromobacter ruhlandii]MCI1838644.1 SMP-30/gluconolactonase/LRE family protein [Achromobacter ruhlandii]